MTPQRFRKKPVEVEAVLLEQMNATAVAEWCGGNAATFDVLDEGEEIWRGVEIPTIEGTMLASPGDYVVRGTEGEFYPCKPHAFVASHEPVADDAEGSQK